MADGGGLENRYGVCASSWVRIPRPPQLLSVQQHLAVACLGQLQLQLGPSLAVHVADRRVAKAACPLAALSASRGAEAGRCVARENERCVRRTRGSPTSWTLPARVVRVQRNGPRSWSSSHSRARAAPRASRPDDRGCDRAVDAAGRGEGRLRGGRTAPRLALPPSPGQPRHPGGVDHRARAAQRAVRRHGAGRDLRDAARRGRLLVQRVHDTPWRLRGG